jgi:hypothetical protein
MRKQIITLLAVVVGIFLPSITYARAFMPRLDQLRNKVETIAKNTPEISIEELLKSARIERDAQGVVHRIIDFGQDQTNIGLLEKEINELYWSNRTELVAQMEALKAASKTERHALLFKELTQKYPNNNRAVVTLAGDLANEETKLNDLTTRILKAMGDEKKSPTATKLNTLFQAVIKLKQNLQIITTFVNDALMS